MVDGKVNIGLSFTADTSKARQELDKLKNDLNKITTQGFSGEKITAPLQQSVEYAGELKAMLDAATDASGKLNLSKFSNELTKSGKTLADFNNVITTGGKEGVAVMNSLAQQIRSADANATILSGTLKKFFDGLKNTATWTIQSNAIHMVESALNRAYSYAQKLNKGLTDIAIVSDLNTKQLAEFARTANQMAKELSASTSEYVSGALIYYQAGLSDEEVIERTNTTIKLAEASGESAEQISSYMTAIWNNFYDGSKSVEYYADAISYLGAVTAASNADIAEGMQAFSAVADTVGLSFEYGASALTLLRDITQQSASTIGNSLKTIFARLSSVVQGDTLEDGVDLTKYSKALAQVGVNVLDANQNLREMDDILDDLGARWDSLNEAQKVALAQTVGGVRQYNNLISLMDNYEQFQELVSEASGSEGYLNHQAEIYAESWEAAANRVEAAWQGLYQQLIDDKFFIALTNGLAGVVNGITKIIDGLGGIWGLLPAIASLYFTIGEDSSINGLLKIRNTTQEIIYNLREARKDNQNNQIDAAGILLQNTTSTATTDATLKYYDRLQEKLDFLRDHQNAMTVAQKSAMEQEIERIKQVINYLDDLDKKVIDTELKFIEWENGSGIQSSTTQKAQTYAKYGAAFKEMSGMSDIADIQTFAQKVVSDKAIASLTKDTGGREFLQKIADASILEVRQYLKEFEAYLQQGFKDIQDTARLDVLEADITKYQNAGETEKAQLLESIKRDILAEDQAIALQEEKRNQLTEEENKALNAQKQRLDDIAKSITDNAEEQAKFEQQRADARHTATNLLGDHSTESQILDQEKWAASIQSVLRLTTSVTTLGTSFNRLWDNIASGKADLGTITGALMGLGSSIVSLLNMTKTLSEMGGILGWLGTGPHMAIIIGIVLALVAGFKLLRKAQEDAYSQSTAGQIEANNKALEKQKEIVKNLTNEYSNLQSTINDLTGAYKNLQKAANEHGVGSPQYLLALEEYKQKLEEIEEKYGDVFAAETDENGIKVIDNNKLAAAKLQEYRTAQAQLLVYQNTDNELRQQKAREDLTDKNRGIATSYDQTVYNAEEGKYVTVTKTDRTVIDGKSVFTIEDTLWNQILDDINNGLKQLENGEIKQFDLEQLLQQYEIDPASAVGKYFVNLFKEYIDATEAVENNHNFGDFVKQSKATDIFAWTGYNKIDDSAVVNTLNSIIEQAIGEIDENNLTVEQQEYKTAGMGDWMSSHHYKYDNNGKIIDENGNPVTELPTTEQLITSGAWADYLVQLENGNEELINQLLDSLNLSDEQREAYYKFQNDQQQFVDDTQRAKSFGLDPEEYKEYVGYLQKINEELEKNQELVDEVALANMRINQGVGSLIENYSDWKDILKEAQEEGHEWDKYNIEYQQAMDGVRSALGEIANLELDEIDGITDDFILEHLSLIEEASYGNVDAIDDLIKAIAVDFAKTLEDSKDNISDWEQKLIDGIEEINFNTIEIGTSIDDQPFYDALYRMVEAGIIGADKINKALANIGYTPIVEEMVIPSSAASNMTSYSKGIITYTDPNTGEEYAIAADEATVNNYVQEDGSIKIPIIKGSNGGKGPAQYASSANMANTLASSVFTGGTGRNLTQTNRNKGASNRAKSNSGSSKKPKTADTTRYHEINSKLEQTAHYLDMVNTAEDRAYGQKKLDLMGEKIKLLEREAKQYKQLYDEAKRYYDQDRDRLQNQYGAAFNADGSIANYDAWYKQFVDRYNAGGMDDDAWSAFEDAIKKYEDSLKHLNDAEKKYQDDLNKIFDQKLEKIEYRLKTITDIIKLDMDYLDYMIEMLDDDGLDTAEAMAYIAKEIADVTDQYTANKQALANIFKNHEGITDDLISGLYNGTVSVQQFIDTVSNFTEKEIESIKSIMSSMYSNGKDLKKYIEDLYGKLGELSDKFQESLDKQIDKLDHMNDIIDKTRNIIDVMGKDTLGISDELLNRMQRAQIEISKEHLATLMQERDQYKLWLEQLEAQYAIMDPESLEAKALKEQIEAYRKTYEEVERKILDTANMTAEQIQQLYITMIEQTVTEAGNKIAGAVGDFEKLMDAYDKQKDLDDLYLKTYEKTYQTNKLLRDIGKSLDDTANLGMQGKLRDLQEEILGYQQEGKQVTEEQMEERRKYYELLLAEAALEEAQNAKNMVRMTRDNEGNWSYTYTADQGKLDDLMNDYNDKLFAYEDYNQKTLESAQDTLLNLQNEYLEALKNARDEAEVQALQAYYEPMIEHQRNMVDYMLMRNNELADNFNVNADEVATKLDDTVYGVTTDFDSMDKAMATFDEAMRIAKDNVITHLQEMDAEQIALANSVGITAPEVEQKLDDIEQGVKDVHTAVAGDGTDENLGIAKSFDNEFNDALDTLKGFHETMGPIIDGIVEDIGKINNKVTEVISAYSELSGVTITPPDLSGAIGAMNALKAAADGARDAIRNAGATPPTATPPGIAKPASPGNYTGTSNFGVNANGVRTVKNKNVMVKMATGGYTGAFGPEGRMAILHEKELVLNKADTQNLLTTVSFVRDLTRMISLNAADASSGLGNLFMGGVGQGGGYLDQTVTIHAEFPNATNHSEIEEAFSNLIGLASQYAGRKR